MAASTWTVGIRGVKRWRAEIVFEAAMANEGFPLTHKRSADLLGSGVHGLKGGADEGSISESFLSAVPVGI
ncbi:hypothetical protein BHE74_00044858 [Ensete ventricosum]|nr:hypothetical protein GW17_00051542 [Ensete ventricosum]RWW49030.1 hypothetical protein BHE74_00044858 [Ensete ventricosum]